jgi:dihydroxyacetone kinase-like predicted kinase
MKKLLEFLKFDWQAFAKDKKFRAIGTREWKDFDTGKVLGTIVDCVIWEDHTEYKQREGEKVSNRFEKIAFKVPKEVTVAEDTLVEPQGVTATVFGDFRNQLSCRADSVVVIATPKGVK